MNFKIYHLKKIDLIMYKNSKIQNIQKRPILITISCILGVISTLITIEKANNNELEFYNLTSIIIAFICVIGIYKMKVWAVFIYLSVFIVNQIMLLINEQWSFYQIILPLIIIAITFKYLNQMKD